MTVGKKKKDYNLFSFCLILVNFLIKIDWNSIISTWFLLFDEINWECVIFLAWVESIPKIRVHIIKSIMKSWFCFCLCMKTQDIFCSDFGLRNIRTKEQSLVLIFVNFLHACDCFSIVAIGLLICWRINTRLEKSVSKHSPRSIRKYYKFQIKLISFHFFSFFLFNLSFQLIWCHFTKSERNPMEFAQILF